MRPRRTTGDHCVVPDLTEFPFRWDLVGPGLTGQFGHPFWTAYRRLPLGTSFARDERLTASLAEAVALVRIGRSPEGRAALVRAMDASHGDAWLRALAVRL